jgi:hypothetical protein
MMAELSDHCIPGKTISVSSSAPDFCATGIGGSAESFLVALMRIKRHEWVKTSL